MISNYDYVLSWLIHFLLILTRMTGMFTLSPVLGRSNVPQPLRIGLSIILTCIVINFVRPPELYPYDSIFKLLIAVAAELAVGLVMGFITILFFTIVYAAGQIMDMQIGFSMVQMYDASTGGQMPIVGSLLNIILIESFLLSDGLATLAAMIIRTFDSIPVGGGVFPPELVMTVLRYFTDCFVLAINIAMPVLASALLAEIALGVIVRTAPQMNVFVVGIPIKVILGLVMIVAMVPIFVSVTGNIFENMYSAIAAVFEGMIPT